jgi:hypothetical protein
LDALISQAYGAQEFLLMGLHTQRAMLILTLFAIPVSFIWYQTEWILLNILDIDAEVSRLAGQWAIILILGLWPNLMFEVLKRFLQGQNVVWPAVVSAAVRTASVLLFSEMAIRFGYGFEGLAAASVAANWVCLIVIVVATLARRIVLRSRSSRRGSQQSYAMVAASIEDFESECDNNLPIPGPSNPLNNNVEANNTVLDSSKQTANKATKQLDSEDNWPAPGLALFEEWEVFLGLGIPGAISLFLEWY